MKRNYYCHFGGVPPLTIATAVLMVLAVKSANSANSSQSSPALGNNASLNRTTLSANSTQPVLGNVSFNRTASVTNSTRPQSSSDSTVPLGSNNSRNSSNSFESSGLLNSKTSTGTTTSNRTTLMATNGSSVNQPNSGYKESIMLTVSNGKIIEKSTTEIGKKDGSQSDIDETNQSNDGKFNLNKMTFEHHSKARIFFGTSTNFRVTTSTVSTVVICMSESKDALACPTKRRKRRRAPRLMQNQNLEEESPYDLGSTLEDENTQSGLAEMQRNQKILFTAATVFTTVTALTTVPDTKTVSVSFDCLPPLAVILCPKP